VALLSEATLVAGKTASLHFTPIKKIGVEGHACRAREKSFAIGLLEKKRRFKTALILFLIFEPI
jgi:hypothetical protein